MKIIPDKAQGFVEYAIFIAVLAAAFMAIRVYFLRAVQEKYRQSADVFSDGAQYEKGVTQVTETVK